MLLRFARLAIAAITICAFIGAGLVMNLPSVQADTLGMSMAMVGDQPADGAVMPCHATQAPPCKDKAPGCMTELGCVFVVGIPVPPAPTLSGPAWFRVTYWQSSRHAEGIVLEPFLGPPIRLV